MKSEKWGGGVHELPLIAVTEQVHRCSRMLIVLIHVSGKLKAFGCQADEFGEAGCQLYTECN